MAVHDNENVEPPSVTLNTDTLIVEPSSTSGIPVPNGAVSPPFSPYSFTRLFRIPLINHQTNASTNGSSHHFRTNSNFNRQRTGSSMNGNVIHLEGERRATWSELLYDIFFVSVMSKLSKRDEIISNQEVFEFVMVFTAVWWCWKSVTLYSSRFDRDDLFGRFLALIQMMATTAFSVTIRYALKEFTAKIIFICSVVVVRLTLALSYYVVFIFVDKGKRFCKLHAIINLIGAVIWGVSIACPDYIYLILWGISYIADLILVLVTSRDGKHSHLPERFGLFTIIVLGEIVINVLYRFGYLDPLSSLGRWGLVYAAMLIVYLLWWVYFDDFKADMLNASNRFTQLWIYIHLPIHLLHLLFSVCITDLIRIYPNQPELDEQFRFLIVTGLLFIFNALMKLLHAYSVEAIFDSTNVAIYCSRFINGLVIFLMMTGGAIYSSTSLIVIITGFCLFQVIVDVVVLEIYNRTLMQKFLLKLAEGARKSLRPLGNPFFSGNGQVFSSERHSQSVPNVYPMSNINLMEPIAERPSSSHERSGGDVHKRTVIEGSDE